MNLWKLEQLEKLKAGAPALPEGPKGPEEPVEPEEPIGPEKPVGPSGVPTDNKDDENAMVKFDEDHENSFLPEIINPAEATLFLSTNKEAREEKKRWENYSFVRPGFGLGNINQNSLAMYNYQQEKKDFTNCYKSEKPGKAPSIRTIEKNSNPENQPFWIPAIMNEYGEVQFEDSFYNNKMSMAFTNPVPIDNKRRTWENSNSIYHPENSLATYKAKPVRIPELRNFAGYRGLNVAPSTQGGYSNNRKVYDDLYKYSPQLSTDFKHKKTDVSNNISYSLPRSGSARF